MIKYVATSDEIINGSQGFSVHWHSTPLKPYRFISIRKLGSAIALSNYNYKSYMYTPCNTPYGL